MKGQLRKRGQSFVLIAIAMAALVLIVGLAVDGANAYSAQRKAQSTANAASLGGTKRLAMARDNPGSYSDLDIRTEINSIVAQNGFSIDEVIAEYLDAEGNSLGPVGSYGDTPPPDRAAFIRVRIGTQVNTYFVRLAGFDQVDVNAAALAHNVSTGEPGCTEGIYPIAVKDEHFSRGVVYWIWDGDPLDPQGPGNFGWLRWREPPEFGSTPYLIEALTPPGNIGDPHVGYFVEGHHILRPGRRMPGSTGLSNASGVREKLDYFVNSGEPLILPLWNWAQGEGSNYNYNNDGFGVFRLEQYCFNVNPNQCPAAPEYVPNGSKAMQVTFLGYYSSGCSVSVPVGPGEGGGQQQYATAQGMVYLCIPQVTLLPPDQGSYLPVDVMHVVDSSGSMGSPLVGGGGKSKMQIEKEALVYFNGLMRPDLGDRLGGVKFRNYNPDVIVLSPLTDNIGYLNAQINAMNADGWTPWAKAVLMGTTTLYGPGRNPDNKPVLIIASDGAPTTDLDNQANGNYQNLEWDEMTPGTLRYCYMNSTCDDYPGCQVPVSCPTPNGLPRPTDDPNVEVLIDALDAADVVKGRKAIGETWYVQRRGGLCGNPTCHFYGVVAHPDMEIFVIAIKGQDEFSSSVLKYVASYPWQEHYFEIYEEGDAQDVYTYIANAIAGQLPYCYIDHQQAPLGQSVTFDVVFGGAIIASGTSYPDGSYNIPNIPVDPTNTYEITGTTSFGGENYGAATSCPNPGIIGANMPLPQVYEIPIFMVPEEEPDCPEGTIPIPPP